MSNKVMLGWWMWHGAAAWAWTTADTFSITVITREGEVDRRADCDQDWSGPSPQGPRMPNASSFVSIKILPWAFAASDMRLSEVVESKIIR